MTTSELVVLLDLEGHPIGTADKATVHTTDTALHLAFSCHVFNAQGQVLITRRALSKKTWPGVWTNSACGHPAPGESMEDAIRRRARHELGQNFGDDSKFKPQLVENEVCPVFIAVAEGDPQPAASEVCEWQWVEPSHVKNAVADTPFVFSPWLVDQMAAWVGPYASETSVR